VEKQVGKKLNYFSSIKFLYKYIAKYKRNYIHFYIAALFTSLLRIFIPITFAIMIDEIIYYSNITMFLQASAVFLSMLLFACLLYIVSETQHCYLTIMYSYDIQKDIFDHLQSIDSEYMTNVKTGDAINIIHRYSRECMYFVIRNIIHMSNNILMLVFLVIYVFIFGWQIGILMIIVVPLSTFTSLKFGKKNKEYTETKRKEDATYSGWLFEILSGLREIRMLGAKNTVFDSFDDYQNKLIKLNVKTAFLIRTAENIISFISLIVRLSIYGVVAIMAFRGNITVGTLTVILAYYASMTRYVKSISSLYIEAQNRISYFQHIYDFMNSPAENDWKGNNELSVTEGEIEFCNIDFSYKGSSPVLKNFNLKINAKDKVAIVGKSGSGKSTLAYLLAGFFYPQSGCIEIDGHPITEYTLQSIRQNIGIVQQDVLIFDGTVKENVLLGNRNATDEEIVDSCKKAGIYEHIRSMPQGFETLLGKGGVELSGGQRQRIAIARIYLKNPKIMIFDEATSALDSETEESIHEAWRNVLSDRTSIVIAHRQRSVMLCEKIVIIDDGRVIEQGVPEELMKNSIAFKTLFAI
jgi:ABC-type multidrug transport system fused ATPase/permease subunit